MNSDLKISIITVCKNAEIYIRECIESVVLQDYPNIEYIIIDGESTDKTLAIIEEYKSQIHIVKSEIDKSASDALNKGFALATGDVLCWLNADDKFHPNAFSTVAKIFSDLPNVDWITGFPTWYTANGACVNEFLPQTDAFLAQFNRWSCERFLIGDYMAIQQESVFWRRELWQKSGATLQQNLIAFDFELWTRFFQYEKLYTAPVVLSGFRVHPNQLSSNQTRYISECENVLDKMRKKAGFWVLFSIAMKRQTIRFFKIFYYLEVPIFKHIFSRFMNLPPLIRYNEKIDKFLIE